MIVSPGKWVSEEQLIALKGIKKGTLKKAREKSFMEGREYKHVAHDGMPWDNSPCFYNLIDKMDLCSYVRPQPATMINMPQSAINAPVQS